MRIRDYGGGEWAIESDAFSPALLKEARATPGLIFDRERRVWVGYRDAVAVATARLRAKGLRLQGDVERIPLNSPTRVQPSYESSRDFQKTAIDFLVTHADEGALLADDLGLGKTHSALRAARAFKEPTLVVCPAFVTGIWGDDETSEVRKWWRDAWPPRVLEGIKAGPWYVVREQEYDELTCATPRTWYWRGNESLSGQWVTKEKDATLFCAQADAEDFIVRKWGPGERERLAPQVVPAPVAAQPLTICNYSILYAWAPHLIGVVKTLICDEAHFISNAKSGRSKAMASIAAACAHRIALTGTPLTNRPRDLHNLVDTISPGRFGGFVSYGIRYANGRKEEISVKGIPRAVWRFDGATNLEELNQRLSYFMLRRTKSEVSLQLPPRTLQTLLIDVKKSYIAAPKSIINATRVSEKALRRALDLAADGKLPTIVDMATSHVEAGHNVVVFCWRRSVCEYLAQALSRVLELPARVNFIHGGVSLKERQRRIASDWRVLVANIDVTAGGISLTRADVGLYAELTWEPHEILQTMGRLHRPGQTEPTLFQFPLARGAVDELLAKSLISKLEVFEKVIGKVDEKLGASLDSTREKDTKAQLKSLYERLKKQQEAEA
jgi:superfamily II DNA or RNA helicase